MSGTAPKATVVARILQLLTLGWFTLTIAAAAWHVHEGRYALAVVGVLLAPFVHAPFIAAEIWMLRRVNRALGAASPPSACLLMAWRNEVLTGLRVFGWQQPYRSRAQPDAMEAGQPRRCGVVLVHGFMCNRGLWNRWMTRLQRLGIPYLALNLEPPFATIDAHSDRIDVAVRTLAERTGSAPVLVGHSMGGLAIRGWLRRHAADAPWRHVITIGTPHRGTWMARFAWARNSRQMRPDSRWLAELAETESPDLYARFTCFYSDCDNVVFPARHAALQGADNRLVEGAAHVDLLDHPSVFRELIRVTTAVDSRAEPEGGAS